MPDIVREIFRKEFLDRSGEIARLYIEAFSDPPYFEAFSVSDVLAMAEKYWFKREDGLLLCCHGEDGNLKGFFAGHNLSLEEGICQVIGESMGCGYGEVFYMAEVAVNVLYRKQGIASVLITEALKARADAYSNFLARTNVDNRASIGLFHKAGFRYFEGARETVRQTRISGELTEDERLFLIFRI